MVTLLAWMGGCGERPDYVIGPSVCDGRHQEDDGDWIDAAFDKDGDGYFDDRNADCVEAYAANRLDCDDDDVAVSPAAAEEQCNDKDDDCNEDTPDLVDRDLDGSPACEDCDDDDNARTPGGPDPCWDGIDNNCTSIVDDDCGPDHNGRYALLEPIEYRCGVLGVPLVNMNFDEVTVLFIPPFATMHNEGGGAPGNMDSAIEQDGSFSFVAERSISTAAACDEKYEMIGRFDGTGSFQASFTATYVGFGCLGCNTQHWDTVVGTKISGL